MSSSCARALAFLAGHVNARRGLAPASPRHQAAGLLGRLRDDLHASLLGLLVELRHDRKLATGAGPSMASMNSLASSGSNWLPAPALILQRVGHAARDAVVAVVGHGVEGVGHGYDPRTERRRLAGQPIWIAVTVPALVVMADDGQEVDTAP